MLGLEACITEIVESQKMIENSAQRFNITLKFKPWREDLEEIVKNISERGADSRRTISIDRPKLNKTDA